MTAQQRRPGEGAADRAATLATSVGQSADSLRRCRSCGKPEGACEARHDDDQTAAHRAVTPWAAPTPPPTGHVDPEHYRANGWCRHGCTRCWDRESRDDDVSRHAGQVLRDLVRATPTPGPLLIALLHGHASDGEEGAS